MLVTDDLKRKQTAYQAKIKTMVDEMAEFNLSFQLMFPEPEKVAAWLNKVMADRPKGAKGCPFTLHLPPNLLRVGITESARNWNDESRKLAEKGS